MVNTINHCELRLVAKFSRGRNIFWGYLSTTYLILTKIYLNLELAMYRALPHTSSKNIKNIVSNFLKTFLHKFLILLIKYRFKLAQLNNFEIFLFFKNCCIFEPVLPGSQACCKVYAPIWSSPITQIMLTRIHFMRV